MKRIFIFLALIAFAFPANAQITQLATTGMAAQFPTGTGSPSLTLSCNSATANIPYWQTDATNGHLWMCDNSTGSWGWDHFISAVQGVVTSQTMSASSLVGLSAPCTAITTVNVPGATVGTNAANAAPIYTSAPTGNVGYFNLAAWVSAANTVSVQGCIPPITGLSLTVPSFVAKIILY